MFFYLSGFGFLSCFLLGGSTSNGHLSDAVLQLLSIPVLLAALWRILDAPTPARDAPGPGVLRRDPRRAAASTCSAAAGAMDASAGARSRCRGLRAPRPPPLLGAHQHGFELHLVERALAAAASRGVSFASHARLARPQSVEPPGYRGRRGERLSRIGSVGPGSDKPIAVLSSHERAAPRWAFSPIKIILRRCSIPRFR